MDGRELRTSTLNGAVAQGRPTPRSTDTNPQLARSRELYSVACGFAPVSVNPLGGTGRVIQSAQPMVGDLDVNRVMTIFLVVSCFVAAFARTTYAGVPDIHVQSLALDALDGPAKDIQTFSDALDIERLAVSYKDGKTLEQLRELLSKQTRVALDVSHKLRQVDSIALAVILSQTLWSIRDTMNTLSQRLQAAGTNATSAEAVRVAIPLVKFDELLLQPLSNYDERVQTIAAAGDDAVRRCHGNAQ